MKQNNLILSLMAIAAMAIATQQMSAKGNNGLGMHISWDYNSPSTNLKGIDSGSGIFAGLVYDIPLGPKLYLEPGIGGFYDTMDVDYFDLYVDKNNIGQTGTIRNWGIRVPVTLGYKIEVVNDISVSLFTGPMVNFGLSDKAHYVLHDIPDVDLYDHGWRRVDAQWSVGVKLHYTDNFFAEISGALGLTNQLDTKTYPGTHLRRNIVTVGLGYKF